jgi:hypothetical protein
MVLVTNAFPLIDPMLPTTLRGDDMSGATASHNPLQG